MESMQSSQLFSNRLNTSRAAFKPFPESPFVGPGACESTAVSPAVPLGLRACPGNRWPDNLMQLEGAGCWNLIKKQKHFEDTCFQTGN